MDDNCEGLPSWDQVRLFISLSPLITFGQRFVAEPDVYKRTIIVADAIEWIASRTSISVDDKVVSSIAAVLKTPEGESLVRQLVAVGELFLASKNPEAKR